MKGENVDDYSDYDEDPAKEDTKTEVNREQSGKPATEAIQINIALPDKFRFTGSFPSTYVWSHRPVTDAQLLEANIPFMPL